MKHFFKTICFALTLALIFTFSCGSSLAVSAAADSASVDFDRTGTICLTLEDSENQSAADGIITVYEVAVLFLDDGNMAYSYTEAFADCTETLDVESSSLATALAKYVTDNGISGTEASVGTDGTVRFDELELGLYLVMQTTPSTGYNTISPFLVTVPYAEEDTWVYEIDASPKVEVLTESLEDEPEETTTETSSSTPVVTETTLPQTGQLNWPIPVLAGSGLLLFAAGWTLLVTDRKKRSHAA